MVPLVCAGSMKEPGSQWIFPPHKELYNLGVGLMEELNGAMQTNMIKVMNRSVAFVRRDRQVLPMILKPPVFGKHSSSVHRPYQSLNRHRSVSSVPNSVEGAGANVAVALVNNRPYSVALSPLSDDVKGPDGQTMEDIGGEIALAQIAFGSNIVEGANASFSRAVESCIASSVSDTTESVEGESQAILSDTVDDLLFCDEE